MTPPVGGSARGLRRPRRLLNSQAYQTLIDDYERSSLDYYTEVSESWSIGNSTVGHGANSVQQDTTGSPGVLLSTPGSGLPHYPTRGDIVSGLVYTEGTPGVILNGKDGNNFYAAVVDDANNDLVFWERNGGTYTKIYEKNISTTISDTTWYEAEVEWAPGDNFDLTVYNWDTSTESRGSKVAFATHNFTPFTDGSGNLANGFGWFNVVNSPTIDADYARLQTQVEIAFLVNSESDIRTTGGSRWYGRPVMAEKSNGDWIACYRDASDHGTYDDSEIHIIFSTDSGASWTADDTYTDGSSVSGFPYSISGESVSIGYPFVAPNDDILVHVSTQGTGGAITGTHQLRSTDGGATWTDEGQVSISGTTNDDQYYAQDHAYNPDTGELVTIFYRDGDGLRWATSTDNGSSWTDEGLIRDTSSTESGLEVGIEYIGNDTYVCLNRGNNGETFLIRSTDGGVDVVISDRY